ncbi:MAG: M55 family metallopeptidase [Fervidicoccaceae archaeon]
MRAFVSVDLEGMPFIASGEHLFVKGALYNEARRIATRVTLAVVEELHEGGFEEVIVADSHGPMINLDVESLPEYVTLIRGFPRPLSMITGIEGSKIAVFLGYHSKAGTARSSFDHTYSSASIDSIEINGMPVSEFLLNAYVAGHFNVPVMLVAGDRVLIEEDVSKSAPWAERVVLKESFSRFASASKSLKKVEREIREAARRAIEKYRRGEGRPLQAESPLDMKVRFLGTEMGDVAELIPMVERIDGKTVKYKAKDAVEAYKLIELLTLAVPRLYPYTYL